MRSWAGVSQLSRATPVLLISHVLQNMAPLARYHGLDGRIFSIRAKEWDVYAATDTQIGRWNVKVRPDLGQ